MAVPILEAADALVAALDAKFPSITVVRTYQANTDREDLDSTEINVVPAGEITTLRDGAGNFRDMAIQVLIMSPVAGNTTADVDAAMELAEAIKAEFDDNGGLRREQMAGADWVALENDPIWDQERLQDADQLHTLITLTYRWFGDI